MRIVVTEKQSGFSFSSLLFLGVFALSAAYSFSVYRLSVLWFGLGACLLSLAGFMHSLWRHELLMQIDDSGIYDRRLGIGKIKWADVEDVQLQIHDGARFLCFKMGNPDPYLARLSAANREKILFHRSLGFQGFNVEVGSVDVNLLDLKRLIEKRVNAAGSAAGSELS